MASLSMPPPSLNAFIHVSVIKVPQVQVMKFGVQRRVIYADCELFRCFKGETDHKTQLQDLKWTWIMCKSILFVYNVLFPQTQHCHLFFFPQFVKAALSNTSSTATGVPTVVSLFIKHNHYTI